MVTITWRGVESACRPADPERVPRVNRFCTLIIAVLLAGPVAAKDRPPPERDDHEQRSLSESVRRVERNTGGRVVGAERIRGGQRDIDRVKVVTPEGRVRVIRHESEGRDERGEGGGKRGRDD